MNVKKVDFSNIELAKHAYSECEKFMRRVEEIGSFEGIDAYGVKDWWLIGYVLSTDVQRRKSFTYGVDVLATDEQERQSRAYGWVMVNAVYSTSTMWIPGS